MSEWNILKLAEELSNANGIPGFEDDIVAIGRKYGEEFADLEENSLRNLYFFRKENTGDKPVVMLDAHSDEVGFMVQAIKPNGTLQFICVGGWVETNIPAHKVRVINADGKEILGIVSSKPPHYMTEAEKKAPLSIESMAIDIGATSYDEVVNKFKIRVGAPVIPDVDFICDEENDLMIGKGFDCRLGCAAMMTVMHDLMGKELDVDLVGSMSVQEEIGTRGAQVSANRIKPDVAIVFEGCPADDTVVADYAIQTAIKKGPMLRHIDVRMVTNPRFQRFALDLAEKFNIPVQEAVRSGGGTNGAPIHLSNNGVPVIVIGLPVRYAHTHYGISSIEDYKNAIKLAKEVILALNADIIKGF